MSSSLLDLPRWTSERIPEDHSDSSDTDELAASDSQDNFPPTGPEEMGNNLSSEYDRNLVISALNAIPDTPSKRSTPLEGHSSALRPRVDLSRPSEKLFSSRRSASGEPSPQSASDSACILSKDIAKPQSFQAMTSKEYLFTAHKRTKDVVRPLQGEGHNTNKRASPLTLRKPLSCESKMIYDGLTAAPSCPLTSTSPQPLSQSQRSPSPTPCPQQFPLSPPRPSQSLSPSALEHYSSDESNDSEMDDLPDIEHLVALTQPNQSPSRKKTNEPAATFTPYNTNRSPSPTMITIKRHMSDSPRITSQPPPKRQRTSPEAQEPIEIVEILDSSSDEKPLEKINATKPSTPSQKRCPTPSQRQRPTPKPKTKLRPHTAEMTTPAGLSSHQPLVSSQFQPPKHAKSYQKHPIYWHLDGSVRIQIAQTCFRLHRSILAQQSKWFEEMFDQTEAGIDAAQNLYDLSHLDITPEDFEELLRALDDTHACFCKEMPFSKLNSLLRVSTILGFTTIKRYTSNALSTMWSGDLANLSSDKIECPTESLALARQCALLPVVKRTLYELVRLSNFGQVKIMPGDVSAASPVRLCPYDKDLLLTAREHLGVAWREALDIDRFPTCVAQQGVVTPADNPLACTAANRALSLMAHHEIMKEYAILDFEYDPVSGLQVLAAAPWKEKGFCQACVEQRRNYWLKERERIWQKLDEWFELPCKA